MLSLLVYVCFFLVKGVPVPQPASLRDEDADTSALEPDMPGFSRFYEVFKFLTDSWR